MLAAEHGLLDVLRALWGKGANVNANEADVTALHMAIARKQRTVALYLINEAPGLDMDAPISGGNTPLMLATAHRLVDVLRALVAKDANVNAKNEQGFSALHLAISEKQRAAALYLINEAPGVDIDAPESSGTTPLMLAAAHGLVGVLRALVAKGANVNAKNKRGFSALHKAIVRNQRAAALYLINEAPGVDIEALDGRKRTVIILVASVGDVAVMKALVDKDADVNTKNDLGRHAAACGHPKGAGGGGALFGRRGGGGV